MSFLGWFGISSKSPLEKAREFIAGLNERKVNLGRQKEEIAVEIRKLGPQIRQKEGKPYLLTELRRLKSKVADLEYSIQDINAEITKIDEKIAALTQEVRRAA